MINVENPFNFQYTTFFFYFDSFVKRDVLPSVLMRKRRDGGIFYPFVPVSQVEGTLAHPKLGDVTRAQ
jgi:hypothetical protein